MEYKNKNYSKGYEDGVQDVFNEIREEVKTDGDLYKWLENTREADFVNLKLLKLSKGLK